MKIVFSISSAVFLLSLSLSCATRKSETSKSDVKDFNNRIARIDAVENGTKYFVTCKKSDPNDQGPPIVIGPIPAELLNEPGYFPCGAEGSVPPASPTVLLSPNNCDYEPLVAADPFFKDIHHIFEITELSTRPYPVKLNQQFTINSVFTGNFVGNIDRYYNIKTTIKDVDFDAGLIALAGTKTIFEQDAQKGGSSIQPFDYSYIYENNSALAGLRKLKLTIEATYGSKFLKVSQSVICRLSVTL